LVGDLDAALAVLDAVDARTIDRQVGGSPLEFPAIAEATSALDDAWRPGR
jgi:hypothetical protein